MKPLTPRQLETVKMVANGSLNKEIASARGIRLTTVDYHLKMLVKKLNRFGLAIKPRIFLTRYAVEKNLVKPIFASLLLACSVVGQSIGFVYDYATDVPTTNNPVALTILAEYPHSNRWFQIEYSSDGTNWNWLSNCEKTQEPGVTNFSCRLVIANPPHLNWRLRETTNFTTWFTNL